MKKYSRILLMSVMSVMSVMSSTLLFLFLFLSPPLIRADDSNSGGSASTTPEKPFRNSEIGYLHATKKLQIQPDRESVFLPAQSSLYLTAESSSSWIFALFYKNNTLLADFPKNGKYRGSFFFTEKGWARTRSAIQADTVPFPLPAGAELPVSANGKNAWTALWEIGSETAVLEIPKDTEGIVFSAKSKFELFSEEQQKKGLTLYRGKWIGKEQAELMRKADQEKKNTLENRMEVLRTMAEAGCLFLADGRIITGKYRGGDGTGIFFEQENGSTDFFRPGDIANLSPDEALAKARIKIMRDLYSKARMLFRSRRYGDAAKEIASLLGQLKQLPPNTAADGDSIAIIQADTQKLASDLSASLEESGLALYQYKTFPKEALQNHLSSGHILFREKIWLNPGQVCTRCSGKGNVSCEICGGAGSVRKDCAYCEGKGVLSCSICTGTGKRQCRTCSGKGSVGERCSRCKGKGVVRKAIPVSIGGGRTVNVGGRKVYLPGGNVWPGYAPVEYVNETCSRCGGTGEEEEKCSACKGAGWFPCPAKQDCGRCSGKGYKMEICEKCAGKRLVSCPGCQGKGYTGEAQKDVDSSAAPGDPGNAETSAAESGEEKKRKMETEMKTENRSSAPPPKSPDTDHKTEKREEKGKGEKAGKIELLPSITLHP